LPPGSLRFLASFQRFPWSAHIPTVIQSLSKDLSFPENRFRSGNLDRQLPIKRLAASS
jgi:hypothetical protein